MARQFFIKDKNLKPENIKSGVKIFKVTGTYEGGGAGDCEQWPSLLEVHNEQTYTHAGVIFDTGFPITGFIYDEFNGYFTIGNPEVESFFLFGNRSNVDPETGHSYYWGIWKYDDKLMVSFGAEAHHDSAEFTLDDEISATNLPVSWLRAENPDYGSSADEYGTEYIYEVKVGNVMKNAPCFEDRLDFFEGLNVCVFGRNSYEYPGEYGASAPGSLCSNLWLSSVDGDGLYHTLTLKPYVKNGTATLYKIHSKEGEETVEGPLEPILHEGAETSYRNFNIDSFIGGMAEIDPSTNVQYVSNIIDNDITPYVTVMPMNLVSTSETITENGQVVISAGDYDADGISEITLDVSVGGGGSDWLADALAGNITDLSGYELPGTTRNYQYYNLFREYNTIIKGPSFSDSSLNGDEGCNQMFYHCSSLTDFDFSNVQEVNGTRICNRMFEGCTSLTNVDLSNLQYISGQEACYAMFSGCSSLTSIDLSNLRTINGGSAVNYMFSGTQITSLDLSNLVSVSGTQSYFLNNITELTINPIVLSSSSQYSSFIVSGTLIEDLYFSANATYHVYLLWQPNLTAASVLNVLTHLDLTISGKSVNFYSSGLTVTDDAQGSIQTAYNTAVAAGWTINNLTIVQP